MNVALDTNAYSGFMRGEPGPVRVIRTASRVVLPLFVVAELRAGFAAGSRQTANANNLQRFLETPRVSVLLPDEATSHHYADVFVFLRRQGARIPANDIWIAALVLQHGLTLCTSDSHFDHLPHLPRC